MWFGLILLIFLECEKVVQFAVSVAIWNEFLRNGDPLHWNLLNKETFNIVSTNRKQNERKFGGNRDFWKSSCRTLKITYINVELQKNPLWFPVFNRYRFQDCWHFVRFQTRQTLLWTKSGSALYYAGAIQVKKTQKVKQSPHAFPVSTCLSAKQTSI